MNIVDGLTFDDVMLVPSHSEIPSRSNIDTSVDLGKGIKLDIPVVSANMKNVTGRLMSDAMTELGGLPIQHRFFDSWQDRVRAFKYCKNPERVAVSIGVKDEDKEALAELVDHGCRIVCIDVAHGDSKLCVDMTRHIADKYPQLLLISGNVATAWGALRLYNAGADVIKVGVGPGSLCTTRIETGNGVPQLTALNNVFDSSFEGSIENRKFKIIADGGIRQAGDIVKALVYSDAVMLGNLLSGTDEAPGDIIERGNVRYKGYAGSSTHKVNHVEGVKALVPLKGPVAPIIDHLMQGVRSGMSYQGSLNLEELKREPEFVRVSGAGLIESHPHDISQIIKD